LSITASTPSSPVRSVVQTACLEQLANEVLELRRGHLSEIRSRVKARDDINAFDERIARQVKVPYGGHRLHRERMLGHERIEGSSEFGVQLRV
jgi:hypothetical protein